MKESEFKKWFEKFANRYPQTGRYISEQSKAYRELLFTDSFEAFELRDAMAMNLDLDDLPAAYDRDRLPAYFRQKLREQEYNRVQRASTRRPEYLGAKQAIQDDAVMGPAYRELAGRMKTWRQDHPHATRTSLDLVSEWNDEIFKKHWQKASRAS